MKKIVLSTMISLGGLYASGNYIPTTQPVQQLSSPSNWYGGLGLAAMSTYGKKEGLFSTEAGQDRTGAIVGSMGYQFTSNIAVEGRLSYGTISTDFSENFSASLFVKPSANVTDDIALYGLLGFGWVNIDGSNGYSDIAKTTSPQFGLGASYKVNEKVDVYADYTWLLHEKTAKTLMPDGSSKVSLEALTVGFNYHF